MACQFAEVIMEGVRSVIANGDVGRRTFPDGSLAEVDACMLLTDDEVSSVLGAPAQPWGPLNRNACRWETGRIGVPPRAAVAFSLLPMGKDGLSEFSERVGGRRTRTIDRASGACAVQTPHIAVTGVDQGRHVREVVSLIVYTTEGSVRDACADARALAELAWPRLPHQTV
jgi:hypothetical protein